MYWLGSHRCLVILFVPRCLAIWGPLCEQKRQKSLHHGFCVGGLCGRLVAPLVVVAPLDGVGSLLEAWHACLLASYEFARLAAFWLGLLLYDPLIDLALFFLRGSLVHQQILLIRLTRSLLPLHEQKGLYDFVEHLAHSKIGERGDFLNLLETQVYQRLQLLLLKRLFGLLQVLLVSNDDLQGLCRFSGISFAFLLTSFIHRNQLDDLQQLLEGVSIAQVEDEDVCVVFVIVLHQVLHLPLHLGDLVVLLGAEELCCPFAIKKRMIRWEQVDYFDLDVIRITLG